MSGREWQPGEVALVRNEWDVWNVAIYSVKPGGMVWQYGASDTVAPADAEARPLVVLDLSDVPADRLVAHLTSCPDCAGEGDWCNRIGAQIQAQTGVEEVPADMEALLQQILDRLDRLEANGPERTGAAVGAAINASAAEGRRQR